MPLFSKSITSRTARLLAPIAAMLILASALVMGLLVWSANEVDHISRERDEGIVSLILERSIIRVAHEQESSTVWDKAVAELARRPLDMTWLDANLGVWFNSYLGHDEVYILDGKGVPLYAMRNGARLPATAYDTVRNIVAPIIAIERAQNAPAQWKPQRMEMLSPGFADLAMVHGNPAIVSAKPVVSDTDQWPQRRGSEAVHVSVVYLDGVLVRRLREDFALAGGRYALTNDAQGNEAAVALRKRDGQPIGYFI